MGAMIECEKRNKKEGELTLDRYTYYELLKDWKKVGYRKGEQIRIIQNPYGSTREKELIKNGILKKITMKGVKKIMGRVCKVAQCQKELIDDRGVIRNYPNKFINKDGGTEWLCDECLVKAQARKAEDEKREAAMEEAQKPEPKEETVPAPKKKGTKKGKGKK